MEFPLEFARSKHGTSLDFSMESLELASQCLGKLKAEVARLHEDRRDAALLTRRK